MHSDPTPPPRLKHGTDPSDPLAKALSDESLAVGAYDMDGLRGRVLDAARGAPPTPPGPAPSSTAWWKIAVISGVTASLVTFGLVQLMPDATVAVPHPPVETPSTPLPSIPADDAASIAVPRTVDSSSSTDGIDLASDGTAQVQERPAASPGSEVRDVPPVDEESDPSPEDAQTPGDGAAAADPRTDEAPTAPPELNPSALAAELADYNQAVDFDARQDWAAALAAWDVYLDRWPDGRLHTEARLGRLRALVGVDQPGQVERLAGELLATPGLRAQRDDLVLTRAEALVKLDRCDEARGLVADRRRSDPGFDRVQAVRSTCRRR